MTPTNRRFSAVTLIMLCAAAGGTVVGAAPRLPAPVVFTTPGDSHTGGAYTAIAAAADGRVYLGTTFYDGFARLLVLEPGAGAFRVLADMGSATGETTPGPYAQAKIHTKPAIMPDGRVYFGTKSGKPADDERWQAAYPGGHLLAFDPRTGRVADLGILRPKQSIIAVGVDPQRNIVYALTDPEVHLWTYDVKTSTLRDRGQFAVYPPTRYLIVLANGDVYHPAGPDAFMRFQAGTGRIERLPLTFTGTGRYEVSELGHGPYAMAPHLDGTRFFGVGQGSGEVYTFTPGPRSLAVQLHGRAAADGAGQRSIHYTMAAGPDGNAYYTEVVLGATPEGTLRLFRLVTKTGRPEFIGAVPTIPPPADWQRPYRVMTQGATVGPDGTLYVMLAYPLRVLAFPRLAAP